MLKDQLMFLLRDLVFGVSCPVGILSSSSLKFEAWFPHAWYGMFIELENAGGLVDVCAGVLHTCFFVFAKFRLILKVLTEPASTTLSVFTLQR